MFGTMRVVAMDFHELRDAVFAEKPMLRHVIERQGNLSLFDYFAKSIVSPVVVPKDRQTELLGVLREIIARLVDPLVADTAIEQLRQHYYVSTADHHGPLGHPFFVNSHLAQSIANQAHGLSCIVVLSCGGISLNNSSFPRGLLLHTRTLTEERLPLWSLKDRHHPVYGLPAYTRDHIHELREKIIRLPLPIRDRHCLLSLTDEVYGAPPVFSYQWFAEQSTYTNYHLWKRIPGQEDMHLLHLEQEDIVAELLCRYHLADETLVHTLILTKDGLDAFEQYFNGIRGAFSTTESRGTFLFWGIHDGQRVALYRRGERLVSRDATIDLPIEPESVSQALRTKTIMPSMALTFIVLSFYYGLRSGGGFSQINYLTEMKTAYDKVLNHMGGNQAEKEGLARIDTTYFCGEFVFSTLKNLEKTVHATSIDLVLYGDGATAANLQALARSCTLAEGIDQMMPEFYKIITGKWPSISAPAFPYASCLYA